MSDVDFDCACDYEPAEFSMSRMHTARKSHRCYECDGEIRPGEQYECTAGKWEGAFSTFKFCTSCLTIVTWMRAQIPCFCYSFGNLIEDARIAFDIAEHRAPDEVAGVRAEFEGLVDAAAAARQGRLQ